MYDNHIKQIPPLSARETLDFFISGKMPPRFRGHFETDQAEILRAHGVNIDTDNRYTDGGFYNAEDK